MKLKKRKKSGRMRGSRTHGWAMKKHKGSGNRGGKGMAGTGKRADQKKSYVIRYLYPYFGKQGYTSRSTERNTLKTINLSDIESNLESLVAQGKGKKSTAGYELDLSPFKILGEGILTQKLIIRARAASHTAIEKVEKIGGSIVLPKPSHETPQKKTVQKKV